MAHITSCYILIGAEAKKVFDDAQLLLQRIVDEKLLKAHGIVTLLPAQSVGDDILVYDKEGADTIGVLHGIREQVHWYTFICSFLSFQVYVAGRKGGR